ncbi:ABC transporter ATP-binding protein/permease [Malikia spinosa]|uniref:ABC transporter ATP-binding protein/permease n=1 Tax=Malikia spinosa TaxID=86180 RepID=A0A7C9NG48_9BURK|nr:ABC transporter ATP-binding protein/permease [Malikia spinosa]MYZ51983.1 ABC transporter ATP-binding protein/permease [Malikia spinosa]
MKSVNRQLWQRFLDIAAPYWCSEERWSAWGRLALLLLLLLGQTAFAVLLNEQTGEFTSALAARDEHRFWQAILLCLGLLVGAVPTYACYYWVRDTLGNHWRRWLTQRFLLRYFGDRHYYSLNGLAALDNPDQRIAEDINTFTQRSLFFLLILIGATMQLTAFSQVLWGISHTLVYFLVVYAISGTVITLRVYGKPLTGLNFRQLKREADLRYSLVRVREKAESIALYRGEQQELQQIRHRFGLAYDNFRQLIRGQFFLNLFQYGYSMLTLVLPSMLIAERVLSGELEVGMAVRAAGAFTAVLSAVSVVIDNFESLSRFAAGIERLDVFSHQLDGPAAAGDKRAAGRIESIEGAPQLELERVTLQTPGAERVLVRELSLAVEPGQGLMVVGASGCGKSSLLRAIVGLWDSGSGKILRPHPDEIMFLPQQPYMLLGSLRSQLLYPRQERQVGDQELLALLERVNLPDLAERSGGLDAELDWEKTLSMGEQQRLAFARLLLTQPRYAILDEATSALDLANERWLYQQLMDGQTTLISVGHRSTLLTYHSQVLELDGNGGWQAHLAQGYRFEH